MTSLLGTTRVQCIEDNSQVCSVIVILCGIQSDTQNLVQQPSFNFVLVQAIKLRSTDEEFFNDALECLQPMKDTASPTMLERERAMNFLNQALDEKWKIVEALENANMLEVVKTVQAAVEATRDHLEEDLIREES